jgi:hypothetical protein
MTGNEKNNRRTRKNDPVERVKIRVCLPEGGAPQEQ